MVYAAIVIAVVSLIVAFTMQPKTPEQKPPSLDDLEIATAEEGKSIPKVYGTYVLKSPNIVYYGDLGYKEVKSGGGK